MAAELPAMEYVVKETSRMPGAELKLTGVQHDDDIDDNEVYEIDTPAYYQYNHYRRMKRIYLSHLKQGHETAYNEVKEYISAVIVASKEEVADV